MDINHIVLEEELNDENNINAINLSRVHDQPSSEASLTYTEIFPICNIPCMDINEQP